jgi:hypothetical protein
MRKWAGQSHAERLVDAMRVREERVQRIDEVLLLLKGGSHVFGDEEREIPRSALAKGLFRIIPMTALGPGMRQVTIDLGQEFKEEFERWLHEDRLRMVAEVEECNNTLNAMRAPEPGA